MRAVKDAECQAHDRRDDECDDGKLRGGGEAGQHKAERGASLLNRVAEVAACEVGEVLYRIARDRRIEAEIVLKRRDLLRARIGAKERGNGVAGKPEDDEDGLTTSQSVSTARMARCTMKWPKDCIMLPCQRSRTRIMPISMRGERKRTMRSGMKYS